jgi:hypothetical protein
MTVAPSPCIAPTTQVIVATDCTGITTPFYRLQTGIAIVETAATIVIVVIFHQFLDEAYNSANGDDGFGNWHNEGLIRTYERKCACF